MHRLALPTIVIVASLAACSEPPTAEVHSPTDLTCGAGADLPTADTMISATIDGHSFVVAQGSLGARLVLGGAGQQLTLFGQATGGGVTRAVRVWFAQFHGVGGYAIGASDQAGAFYSCGGSTHWSGAGSGDSAWVTAFDSATGQLEGTFAFNAPDGAGGAVQVTDGRFRGLISIDSLPPPPPAPPTCADAADQPTSDTLIGARVDGRMVLAQKGSPRSEVYYNSYGYTIVHINGWSMIDSLGRILDLRIYGLHGVGSYPITDATVSGTAWAAYACGYWTGDTATFHTVAGYFPPVVTVPGDSVHVTLWDSVTGHLRGTYTSHTDFYPDAHVPVITEGTFDVMVPR